MRRRRRFMIWEWLAVLTANNGECTYCSGTSQTMDHVIPFADGGADDLTNLVPVCHDCNRRKRDKTPPTWFIGMDLTIRWYGGGTPQGGSGFGDSSMSLREMYLSIHEEVLALLDDLDTVAAEIADPKRREWFETRYRWYGYPSASYGVPRARQQAEERIADAKDRSYPSVDEELARMLKEKGLSPTD
ncbi:HNH endonuclease [Streptomyces scabiei]|uniref:HNH endonuclease n=1 Tax=Streptomyces scabiei TaxID=1930 RepID=UPI0029B61E11|nr:HNH endonuclease signature motif containing protein [Streptomyces scabiei]MDX3205150.1 HNH endonuclease signature motif containing protein [Streptomyces scabiei]